MIRLLAAAVVPAVAMTACLAMPAAADPGSVIQAVPLRDSVPHVTAVGQASAEVTPDRADIRLGISNERPSADAASAETAAQATVVVDAIKAQGVAAADIRSDFNLSAEYDGITDPQTHATHRTLRGYVARAEITVRLRDVAKAGALARLLIDKGANSFEGIDYRYSRLRELQRRLDGEAAKDAELEAHATTDALGVRLGRVLQVGEDAGDPERVSLPVRRMAAAGASAAIPTEPGTQSVTRSVAVTFEIENKAR